MPLNMLKKALVVLSVFAMTGCWALPMGPGDHGATTDTYEVEMEYLPNARLVHEDTSPHWPLGRHAFVKGTDRIVVVTRITSYFDKSNMGKPVAGSDRRRKAERVWITIPGELPLGQAFKLEDIEDLHITGYDVSNLDTKGYFLGPALLLGYIRLDAVNDDRVLVHFDMQVRPGMRAFPANDWAVVGEHKIDVYPDGRHATKAISRDLAVVPEPEPVPPGPVSVNPDPNVPNPDPVKPVNPDAVKPVNPDALVIAQPKVEKPITGRWVCDTPKFEYRFQFDEGGKFIFAHTKGNGITDNDAPGMNYGTFEVKQTKSSEWVVMLVDRCLFDDKNYLKEIYGDKPQLMLKVEWDKDQLVLTGELPVNNNKLTRLVLTPAEFKDMNFELPPRGRKKAPVDTIGSSGAVEPTK
ncbi:MAG: hypothetical protein WD768_15055 [Phycisphaeraceae bacterium]